MKKIAIIGSPGAGKSTLARRLGSILKIKVIHLDRHFWEPGWEEKPRETRREILQDLVQKNWWIIEGTYLNTSDIRLNAADTIIFLDMPGFLCFRRVIRRHFKYPRQPRPDLPKGCKDKLGLYYLIKVMGFPFVSRKRIERKLLEFEDSKKIIRLHSKDEVERFLQEQEKYAQEKTHASKEALVLSRG